MAQELRFGLIGVGAVAPRHVTAIRETPGASLVAVCSRNEQLDFSGTAGTAIYEKGAGRIRWHLREPKADWVDQGAASSGAGSAMGISAGPHITAYQDFAAAIREKRRPLIDGAEGRRSIELIQAVYRSSREGKPIRLG